MKIKMYPWNPEKKISANERWQVSQEVARRLEGSSPGSFATSIEHDTIVFGVVHSDGRIHVFEAQLRSSTLEDTRPKVKFETEGAPEVNTFSRRPIQA